MKFSEFKFNDSLQEGLDAMGFINPTPVQEKAIPAIIEGKDLIACAQTGTGKTAAFVLPILNMISDPKHNHVEHKVNTLIIAPTRELVQQIDQQIEGFSYFTNISSIAIYGGGDGAEWVQQKRAIRKGVDILVATPGRLIALLVSEKESLNSVKHLILDEADRMLDMGFADDIEKIMRHMPKEKQSMFFSATMPPKIRRLAQTKLINPVEFNFAVSKPAEKINQRVYMAHDDQKLELLAHVLEKQNFDRIIVFASTKEKVKNIERKLIKTGLNIKAIHSDREQREREDILNQFKAGRIKTLVGTDIISRGIDVENVDLVVNYDVPSDPEDYVHRIGRTARAKNDGVAITFVNRDDIGKFNRIEKLIERVLDKVTELPDGLGEGPQYKSYSGKNNSGNHRNFNRKKSGRKWHKKPKR